MKTMLVSVDPSGRGAVICDPQLIHGPPPEVEQVAKEIATAVADTAGAAALPLSIANATTDSLLAVHDATYLAAVAALEHAGGAISETTFLRPGGESAARRAAGAAVQAVDEIWKGTAAQALLALGPPGHHAGISTSSGWCVYNNVAVAAARALVLGAKRVLILDWDAHHGNGTQEIFWSDARVLTISIHQARHFPPGSGDMDAHGSGPAAGTNLNIPLPPGSGGRTYRALWNVVIEPAIQRFAPDVCIVAAGLDASFLDPMARMRLTSRDFHQLTSSLLKTAEQVCDGRLILSLEGAYSVAYSPLCASALTAALVGSPAPHDPFIPRWRLDLSDKITLDESAVVENACELVDLVPTLDHAHG